MSKKAVSSDFISQERSSITWNKDTEKLVAPEGSFPLPKQALPKALPCWLAHPGGDALDELGQLLHLHLGFSLQRGEKLR